MIKIINNQYVCNININNANNSKNNINSIGNDKNHNQV